MAPAFLEAAKGIGPLAMELGEPMEDCHEEEGGGGGLGREGGGSGVFVRRWSGGGVTRLDCGAWNATLA